MSVSQEIGILLNDSEAFLQLLYNNVTLLLIISSGGKNVRGPTEFLQYKVLPKRYGVSSTVFFFWVLAKHNLYKSVFKIKFVPLYLLWPCLSIGVNSFFDVGCPKIRKNKRVLNIFV